MIIFVTGGSACGKSEYAERIAVGLAAEGNVNDRRKRNEDKGEESKYELMADGKVNGKRKRNENKGEKSKAELMADGKVNSRRKRNENENGESQEVLIADSKMNDRRSGDGSEDEVNKLVLIADRKMNGGQKDDESEIDVINTRINELDNNAEEIIYIATMRDNTDEAKRRIMRHKELRGSYPYNVRDCFTCEELNGLTEELDERKRVVLFDCLSAFVASVMFSEEPDSDGGGGNVVDNEDSDSDGNIGGDDVFDSSGSVGSNNNSDGNGKIGSDGNFISDDRTGGERKDLSGEIVTSIMNLAERCEYLIIVADMVFFDGVIYDKSVEKYISLLGDVCCRLANFAADVVEVVCGIPIMVKGEDYELLKINNIGDVYVY